jgi:hypothetical protein
MIRQSFVLAALALAATNVLADGWKPLPVATDSGYKLDPVLALSLAHVHPDNAGAVTAYGVDFNFDCLLLRDPLGRMRSHLNLSRADEKGVDVTAFEMSPPYTIPLGGGLSAGVGPRLAVFDVTNGTTEGNLFGIGVGAGIHYRVGMLHLGADLRHHETAGRSSVDHDNLTIAARVGVHF